MESKKKVATFVLTVYWCGGVQFHAGPKGDFEKTLDHEDDVIKKFYIEGEVVKEE